APTIPFRDLVIQKRENDLVGASFGRGFFVLDDYSALREVNAQTKQKEGHLFPTRKAHWYIPKNIVGNTGGDYYFAENPEFGAWFTYHLSREYPSKKKSRKEAEKELEKQNKDIPFPGWDALEEEKREEGVKIWIAVMDQQGNVVRKVKGKAKKGINRVAWDLRHSSIWPIRPGQAERSGGWRSSGPPAMPGTYTATLMKEENGTITTLDGPISFEVVPLREGTLKGISYDEFNQYITEFKDLQRRSSIVSDALDESMKKVKAMQVALSRTNVAPGTLDKQLHDLKQQLYTFEEKLEGNSSRDEIGERNPPTVGTHLRVAMRGMSTTYGPTPLHKQSMGIAGSMLNGMIGEMKTISTETIPALEQELKRLGAPYIIGQGMQD
ncbi:MAG: glycosyl hydrolase, partial [Eudoraea sp.]|nr:glycosyl hydrolase [Eudoraea sp.]NNJ39936.1 glycosyl hydrolase [Eudoraea sp.]